MTQNELKFLQKCNKFIVISDDKHVEYSADNYKEAFTTFQNAMKNCEVSEFIGVCGCVGRTMWYKYRR